METQNSLRPAKAQNGRNYGVFLPTMFSLFLILGFRNYTGVCLEFPDIISPPPPVRSLYFGGILCTETEVSRAGLHVWHGVAGEGGWGGEFFVLVLKLRSKLLYH